MTDKDQDKLSFEGWDGTPGDAWDKFAIRLMNGSSRTDDRGWSYADHFSGQDEGGPNGPAFPANPADNRKAQAAYRKRQKESYGILTRHILATDIVDVLSRDHFQKGKDAYDSAVASGVVAVDRLKLDEMDDDWKAISIIHDTGVNENSIPLLCTRIRFINAKRPRAEQKDESEQAEKLLECLFKASKHFSEGALIEYQAAPGARQWEHPAPNAAAIAAAAAGLPAPKQHRNFRELESHYAALWRNAVRSKLSGFHVRAAQSRPSLPSRQTLEQGASAHEVGGQMGREPPDRDLANAGAELGNTYVPRSGSPSDTLAYFAAAGDELAARRGTVTTTDWSALSQEDMAALANCGAADSDEESIGGEVAYLFDADDQASIELLCNCCGGAGHLKAVCPSSRNRARSHKYMVGLHQAQIERKDARGPPRRVPGRGQRPPFRSFSKRFQPKPKRPPGLGFNARPLRRSTARSAEEGDWELHELGTQKSGSSSSSSASRASINSDRTFAATERTGSETGKFAFSLSDDALFDQGRVAIESGPERMSKLMEKLKEEDSEEPEHPAPRSSGGKPSLMLIGIVLAVMTAMATAYEYISKMSGYVQAPRRPLRVHVPTLLIRPSFVMLFRFVIMMLILVTAPVGRADVFGPSLTVIGSGIGIERALINTPTDFLDQKVAGVEVCVDSGCTTTSIPEEIAPYFAQRVLEANPNRSLYIADDKGLPITKVIATELPVVGFKASSPDIKVQTVMPVSRALIVRGMKKNMILLSPRVMKKDGVNTYLNDDNSIGRSDCLYMKSTDTVIPFACGKGSYSISLNTGEETEQGLSSMHQGSIRPAANVHTGLGHVGRRRISASKLMMDGVPLKDVEHDESTCPGCRLGNTGRNLMKHKRTQLSKHGDATRGFNHFGQQMDSDICTGFVPSFPHGFTAMVNFIDRYGHESFLYYLKSPNSHEVSSAGHTLQESIKTRLVDGKIGRWVTDNGLQFIGDETDEMAKELCRDRGFQVPNDSDTLPVPERHWGVIQRMMRSMHAQAFGDSNLPDSPGAAGQCLWPWGAAQANRLLYYLPTSALSPPQSPYEFTTGNSDPVDISWARTMYCDCTVVIADRDRNGKLGNRSADACHLGYDARRGCHFCYAKSLNRLGSFQVSEWREDSFTIAKTITADTPVEYVDARDLEMAPVTSAMMPRRYTARAGTELKPLKVVFVFGGTEEENTTPAILREQGHEVKVWDNAVSPSHDLLKRNTQLAVKDDCKTADFVFMSPPCDTASIAHDPPLRTIWAPKGRTDLTPEQRAKVNEANILYDFCGELGLQCVNLHICFLIESAASRRVGPRKCIWHKYANNGFLWDYPAITALAEHMIYLAYAQCFFMAPWQKFTGLLIDNASYPIAKRIFGNATCLCASHPVVLRGYDETGVARTRTAQRYVPANARAFAAYIVEACGSNQEGERGDEWSEALLSKSHIELCTEIAAAAVEDKLHHFEISYGKPLPVTTPTPTSHRPTATKHPEPTMENEMEVWMDSADGAFRVSEIGTIPIPNTVEEAKKSEWWPMFKKAMEEEIGGKLANRAWAVVKRPTNKHVLKSKWVFTVKYNDDGSILLVKARFVGCGYSQIENTDFDQVFASNLSAVAFRFLISCIADEDLETDHTDAVKAFTQADVDHEIYVEMPEGFGSPGYVLLLFKALEGIKQGAYLWFKHNRAAWTKLGATSWLNEPNLYWFPDLKIRIGVFADDTLSGYPLEHRDQYKAIKKEYGKLINIGSDEISPVLKFTGVQFDRSRSDGTITIHMERYIDQLCEDYKGMYVPGDMPYGESEKERKAFDNMESSGVKTEKGPYLQLMGKLVWPSSMVRLDTTFSVNKLCSKASDPDAVDFSRGLQVVGYLSTTRRMGITYGGRIRIPMGLKEHPYGFVESKGLYVAHDNSFGTTPRPMGGYVVMYCNGAIDWSAGSLKIVPDSSHEAESAQASRSAKAGIYARQLVINNGRRVRGPTVCFGDNKSNKVTSQQVGSTARTRYYERAIMLFKRAVLLLILTPWLVGTADMVADIFTKATDKATFTRLRNAMMNVHGPLRATLEKSFRATTGSLRRLVGSLYSTVFNGLVPGDTDQ